MSKKNVSGFTLIEMLVVIAIIATIAAFAVPALTSALSKGQMTGTMNNARQLFLAGQQMALDAGANSDATMGWPGDISSPAAVTSMVTYCNLLVKNNYISAGDLQKLLSAPGSNCTVTGGTTSGTTYTDITAITNPALKMYLVKDNNPASTLFAVTKNYTYNTALTSTGVPYGDKGFVVQRKGGDAAVLKKGQAVKGSGANADSNFQNLVGRLPGDTEGTLGTESQSGSGQNVLTNP